MSTEQQVGRSRGMRRQEVGVVTSSKNDKTVVVAVERTWSHPVYKKVVRSYKKYLAHDESNRCEVGDRVRLIETRPMSARKRWRVAEIIQRAPGAKAAVGE